jgi:hypothetical protein
MFFLLQFCGAGLAANDAYTDGRWPASEDDVKGRSISQAADCPARRVTSPISPVTSRGVPHRLDI